MFRRSSKSKQARSQKKRRVRVIPPRRATTSNAVTLSTHLKSKSKKSIPKNSPSMKRAWTVPTNNKQPAKNISDDDISMTSDSPRSADVQQPKQLKPKPIPKPKPPVEDFGDLDLAHSEFIDDAIGDPEVYGVQITTENYDHVLKALAHNPTITAVSLPRDFEDEQKMMKIFEVLETMESLYILSLYPFCNSLCKEVVCDGLTRMVLRAPLRYLSIEGSSWQCCRNEQDDFDDEKGFDLSPQQPKLAERYGFSPPATPVLGARTYNRPSDFSDMDRCDSMSSDFSPPFPSRMSAVDDVPPPVFRDATAAFESPPQTASSTPKSSQSKSSFRPTLPPLMPRLRSFGRSQSNYETKPSSRRLSSSITVTPPAHQTLSKKRSNEYRGGTKSQKLPQKPPKLSSGFSNAPTSSPASFSSLPPSQPSFGSLPPSQPSFGSLPPSQPSFGSLPPSQPSFGSTPSQSSFNAPPSGFNSPPPSNFSPPFGASPTSTDDERENFSDAPLQSSYLPPHPRLSGTPYTTLSLPGSVPTFGGSSTSFSASPSNFSASSSTQDAHCSSGFCLNSTLLKVLADHKTLEHIRLCCCPASFSQALQLIAKPNLKEIILSLSFPGREIFPRAERISKVLSSSLVSHVTLCYMAHENIAETFIEALKTNYNILTFDIKPPELDLSMSLQMPMLQLQRTTGYIRVDRQQEVEIDKLIARNVDFAKRDRVLILREKAGLVADVANIVVDFLFGETKRKPKRSF